MRLSRTNHAEIAETQRRPRSAAGRDPLPARPAFGRPWRWSEIGKTSRNRTPRDSFFRSRFSSRRAQRGSPDSDRRGRARHPPPRSELLSALCVSSSPRSLRSLR